MDAGGNGPQRAAQLDTRDAQLAADEAALRVLTQLNVRLLASQATERAVLEGVRARQRAIAAESADIDDQIRDLNVHVRAHVALAGEAADGIERGAGGGVALPRTPTHGPGSGAHFGRARGSSHSGGRRSAG
mmetsp:Transcript_23212/g.58891  ORF Transcript_23212/g.58891 Transcript_23212/m.58891 type:complete len:132 (+) Transcript_23212:1497-1892(+)